MVINVSERKRRPSIFEEMIKRMQREIERTFRPFEDRRCLNDEFDPFEEMMKGFDEAPERFTSEEEKSSGKVRRYGPFVYGFSYSKRPGEEPEIQEFGNIKSDRKGEIEPMPRGEREPLTDITDMGDRYEITVEIPGVNKGEIDISATEDSLNIKTTGERKFRKELNFKDSVDPDGIEANFKHGVLYMDIDKKEHKEKEGKKIDVE